MSVFARAVLLIGLLGPVGVFNVFGAAAATPSQLHQLSAPPGSNDQQELDNIL